MLTFISISLTLLFIFEVTWRMEHSRYFFSSRMETLPFSYIWLKYDILMKDGSKLHDRMVTTTRMEQSLPGSTPVGTTDVQEESRKILCGFVSFALKPCIAVRVGAAMPV